MSEHPFPERLPVIIFEQESARAGATGQCDCDCDCACSELEMLQPAQAVSLVQGMGEMLVAVTFSRVDIETDFTLCYGPGTRPSLLNPPAMALLGAFESPQPAQEGCAQFVDSWGQAAVETALSRLMQTGLLARSGQLGLSEPAEQSAMLTAWLHLTDRCNLRCTYCYLPHQRQDMSLETGRAAVQAVFHSASQHGYERVKLKFAGGEPLLCLENILLLQAQAQQLAASQDITLDSVVLSNGTLLTAEKAARLYQAGLRLMISLDGLDEVHDQQRQYTSGKGTFQQVVRGIQLAQDAGLTPDISITISAHNSARLAQLVTWLVERDLPFSLNYQRDHPLAAAPMSHSTGEHQAIIDGVLAAFSVLEHHLPDHSVLNGLLDRANLAAAHQHTCAAGRDYLVFDQRGYLLPCQMERATPLGDVESEDPLAAVRSRAAALYTLPVEAKQPCGSCEWRYWCAGGCPLLTYRSAGRADVQSPYCDVYQALFPAVLRLEGKRLLARYAQ